jgi:hypothetical protein
MRNEEARRRQLAENMRFYAEMRFKQLTLLLAWLTVAAAGVAQYGETDLVGGLGVRQVLAPAALLFTAVMWVMEVRAAVYWRVHRDEAGDLWPRPQNDSFSWINASNALLVLHIAIYSFWLWCASAWRTPRGAVWGSALLGVLLLAFSVRSYWKYRLQENKQPQRIGHAPQKPG